MKRFILGATFLGLAGGAIAAQDQGELKKKIMQEVEKRLKQEDERLMRDIEKVIEEALGGAKKATPAPAPTKVRGFLGVRHTDLTAEEKKDLGVDKGVKILEVVPDSPAATAGLEPGDVITAIDGRAIDVAQEIIVLVQAAGAGTKLKVDVLRDGKKKSLEVTLARHPDDPAETPKAEAPVPRERVKKFLEEQEAERKAQAPPKPKAKPAPSDPLDDFLAFDESTFDQMKGLFEQFGVDPEQFFEKGGDGKYRLNEGYREMLKGLDLKKLFKDLPGLLPGAEPPAEVEPPKKAPARPPPKVEAPRPWLGLQPEELGDEVRAQLDLEEGVGLLVSDVVEGSPAAAAGLKKNDILVKIDGRKVKGEAVLADFMKSAKIGQKVDLTVLRKAKEQSLTVTLGERKE